MMANMGSFCHHSALESSDRDLEIPTSMLLILLPRCLYCLYAYRFAFSGISISNFQRPPYTKEQKFWDSRNTYDQTKIE